MEPVLSFLKVHVTQRCDALICALVAISSMRHTFICSSSVCSVSNFAQTTEELLRTIPAADVQFQSACSRAVMKTIAVSARSLL
jgi:hypothetical protein